MWFLNTAMLFGLLGVGLPVMAHLLSKKKYDIVRWGAMQFLELGRNTQRRVRLEEMLLMSMRMGMIALLAIGLARPWISSGWFGQLGSSEVRDVAFVIDGSSSMGWEGKTVTPHSAAIQWAHRYLEQLRGGDTVAILDARDVVRPVLAPGSTDFRLVRKALNELPSPGGGADLVEATSHALRLMNSAGNLARDIIVLTDLQARAWSIEDIQRLEFLDEQRRQPAIVPKIWVVDVGGQTTSTRENFSLDRLKLSRYFTAPDLPVRIQTKLLHHGGDAPASRKIYLEVDGQRISNATLQSAAIPPGGEFSVEFDHRFTASGVHLVSIVLDRDNLPGDDRAEAAVEVTKALPVVVVDGAPHPDETRSETFFLKRALGTGAENALIKPQIIPVEQLTADLLKDSLLLVLANVPKLSATQAAAVTSFVDGGGGLLISLGDQVQPAFYNEILFAKGQGVLPATLTKIEQPPPQNVREQQVPIVVDNTSLELPWVQSFRKENQGGLTETRFDKWWQVTPVKGDSEQAATGKAPESDSTRSRPASIAARLSNGDPFLLERDLGHGRVILMTAPLDSDWSTLPAKPDYVPFLHETLFHLASGNRASRNVSVGEPIVLPVGNDFDKRAFVFQGPGKSIFPVELGGHELRRLAKLDDTSIPGVYRLIEAENGEPKKGAQGVPCVVNFDRRESDLTILSPEQRKLLEAQDRLKIIADLSELRKAMFSNNTKSEFWQFLLLAVMGMLVVEVWLTRRLVQGGHALLDD
ncbi:MAG: hypothetical protein JWM11_5085 [Planctomycetaceae bacterium]|nr:hypothetical protein [Planctomycetaceae bacterium]